MVVLFGLGSLVCHEDVEKRGRRWGRSWGWKCAADVELVERDWRCATCVWPSKGQRSRSEDRDDAAGSQELRAHWAPQVLLDGLFPATKFGIGGDTTKGVVLDPACLHVPASVQGRFTLDRRVRKRF